MKKTDKKWSGTPALRGALFLALLSLFALTGCASQKIIVPTVSESAAQISLPGKFIWFDLFSTDMTSSENFYDAIFGWDFERTNEINPGVKTIFYRGKPIGNMIGREAEAGNSQWLAYMSVPEVDMVEQIAAENGGEIVREAKDLPDRGRVAVIRDPQKAAVALLTSSSGDPVDTQFMPNLWLGAELWTTDVDGAVAFYQKIAQYDVSLVDVHDKVQYRMLSKNGKRRGGIVSIPWKDVKPEWVPYVAVDNLLTVLTKVEKWGGKVLLTPDMSIKEGHVAIIADPSGAVIGVQQIK